MITKTLSDSALHTLDQYLHFTIGPATCSVPYFNNKTKLSRGALRVNVGKGSPQNIQEEIQTILIRAHVEIPSLTNESLKKILTDSNTGIDCSGFVYHILNNELLSQKKGSLKKHISFVTCRGMFSKIRALVRPVENCNVRTFAHDTNSSLVKLLDIKPGDMITMLQEKNTETTTSKFADHILIFHQVDYDTDKPKKIYYSHAVAYPEQGVYGTGIKQGIIEIENIHNDITKQIWTEDNKTNMVNNTYVRALASKTEIRRIIL